MLDPTEIFSIQTIFQRPKPTESNYQKCRIKLMNKNTRKETADHICAMYRDSSSTKMPVEQTDTTITSCDNLNVDQC